jgi:hypothetical protein
MKGFREVGRTGEVSDRIPAREPLFLPLPGGEGGRKMVLGPKKVSGGEPSLGVFDYESATPVWSFAGFDDYR